MSQGFGTIFDPVVLQAFITSMGAYPVGTPVRLEDGRLAIVIAYRASSPMDRPVIQIVGESLKLEVDLSLRENQNLKIKKSEPPEELEEVLGEMR